MNELIDIAINRKYDSNRMRKEQLLTENNLNEDQWNYFVDLMDDLDLNQKGAQILLQEIMAGKVSL